jgi:hypothetical protein
MNLIVSSTVMIGVPAGMAAGVVPAKDGRPPAVAVQIQADGRKVSLVLSTEEAKVLACALIACGAFGEMGPPPLAELVAEKPPSLIHNGGRA